MSEKKAIKKRNWCFFVYPESAPIDWKEKLQQKGLVCAISPLHDKDVHVEEIIEEEKKAHWHVIACWEGPTTYNVVKALTDELCAPIPKPCETIRGYYRYFTHKDNPDKYQYDEKDIQTINGFNIADFIELTKSEVQEIKRRIQSFVRERDILEYGDLMDILIDEDRMIEHEVANNHTFYFDRYISSRRNKKKDADVMSKTELIELGNNLQLKLQLLQSKYDALKESGEITE